MWLDMARARARARRVSVICSGALQRVNSTVELFPQHGKTCGLVNQERRERVAKLIYANRCIFNFFFVQYGYADDEVVAITAFYVLLIGYMVDEEEKY